LTSPSYVPLLRGIYPNVTIRNWNTTTKLERMMGEAT
jgi:uncharacterized protein (DUF1697 family)